MMMMMSVRRMRIMKMIVIVERWFMMSPSMTRMRMMMMGREGRPR
jgi:hypothetical protein